MGMNLMSLGVAGELVHFQLLTRVAFCSQNLTQVPQEDGRLSSLRKS